MWQEILKNVENEKCTLQDLEYGKESKNQESETQTLQAWNVARNSQNVENEKFTHQDLEYGEKTENPGK